MATRRETRGRRRGAATHAGGASAAGRPGGRPRGDAGGAAPQPGGAGDTPRPKVTRATLDEMKRRGERIVMMTAYDHPFARLADAAGVDMLLVGDSLGMVVLGLDSTLPVTLQH